MSCPDWPRLVEDRDERPDAWDEALRHFDQCPECHETALAAEPTLLFRRLPAPTMGDADIESMKTAVAALRRTQAYNQPSRAAFADADVPKRRASQWLQLAAALVATLGTALLLGSGILADKESVGTPATPDAAPPSAVVTGAVITDTVLPNTVVADTVMADTVVTETGDGDGAISAQLQEWLGHADYLELARRAMAAEIGEQIRYSLGEHHSILFRLGSIAESFDGNRRLRLEGFRIFENPPLSANKSRQMDPIEVFNATVELQVGHGDAEDRESFQVTVSANPSDTEE